VVAQGASTLVPGANTIKLQDFEAVFHTVGGVATEQALGYTPVVGDYIVGMFQVTTINAAIQDGTLTGTFVERITNTVAPNATFPGGATFFGASDINNFKDINGNTFSVNINNAGGEMFKFWENPTNSFNVSNANMGTDIASVQVGSVYASLGIASKPGFTSGYSYSVPDTQGAVADGFAALNLITNNTGFATFFPVNDPAESAEGGGTPGLSDPNTPPGQPVGSDSGILTKTASYFDSKISQNTLVSGSPFTLQSSDPAFVVVPAPKAAWGGIALIGLLGATQLRRRATV
jgi:hypothetical protein